MLVICISMKLHCRHEQLYSEYWYSDINYDWIYLHFFVFSFLTADSQALVMIALSYFLFAFVCLAHSRRYYYGQSYYGNQGRPMDKRYLCRTLRQDGGWDLGTSDFNMPMELNPPLPPTPYRPPPLQKNN